MGKYKKFKQLDFNCKFVKLISPYEEEQRQRNKNK